MRFKMKENCRPEGVGEGEGLGSQLPSACSQLHFAKPVRRQEDTFATSTVSVYLYATRSFRQPSLLFSCVGSNLDQKAKPKGL